MTKRHGHDLPANTMVERGVDGEIKQTRLDAYECKLRWVEAGEINLNVLMSRRQRMPEDTPVILYWH